MKTIFTRGRVFRSAVLPALFIITAFSFSGCERIKETYSKVKTVGAAGPQEAPIFAVNTTTAVRGQIQDYLAFSGDIISGSSVDVYSDAAGKITELYVSVGDRVNRGSPVAAVDPSRPGMDYRISVASAPISGTVIALPAQLGMTVSQAVPLARLSGGGGLEIRLSVAERFISKMAVNLPCQITLDAWPGEIFQGRVSEVSPTVDAASRTMEIKITVNNAGSKLKAGMFAKVKVITERKSNIVKIPATAIVSRFGEQYVFSVDRSDPENPIVSRKVITPGILIDGVMEIQAGLAPDEEIVVRGQTLLSDGAKVNIVEQTAPLSVN